MGMLNASCPGSHYSLIQTDKICCALDTAFWCAALVPHSVQLVQVQRVFVNETI